MLPRRRDDDADALFLDDATQNEAALALLRQSTAPGMESPQLVAAVAQVARAVPCLRLEYGSSAAACDLLCQRFDIA
ncbi:MAG: hypothetical protein JNL07_02500 [Rhodospirillales bacterium]|nr:hypothetical protein [Rhodospirillales bacterium]